MLMYHRHRSYFRFFSVFTLVLFLPVAVEYWHFTAGMAWAAGPDAPKQEAIPPLTLLSPEMLGLFTGGPASDTAPPSQGGTLREGRILLAQAFDDDSSRSGAERYLAEARTARDKGDAPDAAVSWFSLLDRYPHGHEAVLAQQEIAAMAAAASRADVASAAREVATLAANASAPARKAVCELLSKVADTDGDAAILLADTAVAALRAHPNAPESYDFPAYLQMSGTPDTPAVMERLAAELPGTLAAWRCDSLLRGMDAPWDGLIGGEARHGLVRAYSDRAKGDVAGEDPDTARRNVLALARRTFWEYPHDAAQSRIAPLFYDALKAHPRQERAALVMELRSEVNFAVPSLAAWMVRGLLYTEMIDEGHAWGEASIQIMNQLELDALGVLNQALDAVETDGRDKARIAYYRGLAQYHNGWEQEALRSYEEALQYPCSDVIREYALYAKAYALASTGWYTGELDAAVGAYQSLLAAHPHGKLAPEALIQLARIYYAHEDYDSGNLFAERVLRDYPESEMARGAQVMLDSVRGEANTALAASPAPVNPNRLQVCGPVALEKLLAIEGVAATVDELAALAGTDGTGTSMRGLAEAARAKGVDLAGVQIARGAAVEPPFIAYVNGDHFVLVRERGDRGYLVEDVDGVALWQKEETLRFGWDGKALVLSRERQVARLLGEDTLIKSRGGDTGPTTTNKECRNGHLPPSCNNPGGPNKTNRPNRNDGPGGCGWEGDGDRGGGVSTGNTHAGFMAEPAPCREDLMNSDQPPGMPGGPVMTMTDPGRSVQGFNPEYMLFQGTFLVRETDFSVPVAGGMNLNFTRVFSNQFGYNRNDYSNWFYDEDTQQSTYLDLPYRNNIGTSWSHHYNMHLRISQEYGFLVYYDAMGNPTTYTRHCETPPGSCAPLTNCITTATDSFPCSATADYYVRNTQPGQEAHGYGYKGELWEEGVVITRHLSGGQTSGWTLRMPGGAVYGFGPETAWDEHYARLEYIENSSGARVTLSYDGYGRLSRVDAPTGDGRYLLFAYSGSSNRISSITLRDGAAALQTVNYIYDTSQSLVRVDRDGDDTWTNDQRYGYGTDTNYPGSYMLTSLTDENAVPANISYTWGSLPPWNDQPLSVTVTKGGIQRTTFQMNPATTQVTATNYDTQNNPVSKVVYLPDWYATTVSWVRFYLTPTGGNYQQWYYYYNTDHFLTHVYRPSNNTGGVTLFSSYTYNNQGKTLTESRPAPNGGNLVTSWQYDTATGLLPVSRTDPDGLITDYIYDGYGRLIQMKHPAWGTNGMQYTYTASGQLESVINPLGHTTTHGYDARGNRVSITNPLNQTTTMAYDGFGRVSSVTDPLGKTTSYTYIGQGCGCGGVGKLESVTDADNKTTSFQYDGRGNVTKVTDPGGLQTDYQYDNLDRLTRIVSPSGTSTQTTFTLDTLGRVQSVTDFGGRTVSMTYDHMGRTVTRTDAAGTVSNAYDAVGNLTSVTDERGKTTTYSYFQGAWPNTTLDPVGKRVVHAYDTAGRLIRTGAGSTGYDDRTEYTFSPTTGLLAKVRAYAGAAYHDVDYTYDGAARLTKAGDWVNSAYGIQFGYDNAGRLLQRREYSASKTLSHTYNAAGRLATMTDPNGQTTSYAYTDAGRLASITAPGGKVWSYQYDTAGRRSQYTHPNGTRTEYGYDTRNRLTSIIHRDTANNAVLDSFTLTLNTGGDITRITHADNSRWDYTYDGRGRVYSVGRRDTAGSLTNLYVYTHDAADNLTQKQKYTVSSNTMDTWVHAYNDANEQTSTTLNGGTPETRTYDSWGRLATRALGTYSATYGYRYGGRLYNFTSNFPGEAAATFEYRGDGRLHRRTVGTDIKVYRYDAGWNAINTEDNTGALLASSVYEPGQEVGQRLAYSYGSLGTGTVVYAYHDQLGSTRRWRLNKSNWGANEYEPYGEAYAVSTLAPRDYALHEWDPAIAAYRAPYRNYSPTMARWMTRDPLGMVDGPNMYGYVGGRTIDSIDEQGTIAYLVIIKIGWSTIWGTAGAYALYQCIKCHNRAERTNEHAKNCLDTDDYNEWYNNAQPGAECRKLCALAARHIGKASIPWIFKLFPQPRVVANF